MRNLFSVIIIFCFVSLSNLSRVYGQAFDYEHFPKLDFNIEHLKLDLSVDPEESDIKGTATYQMKANIGAIDTLVLQAAHMEIEEVQVEGKKAEFSLSNDSLFIVLQSSPKTGNPLEVSVSYESVPGFGLLKDNEGTMWTSMLPLSSRHWLPIIDHPRVALTSDISITVPSGYQAVATGVQKNDVIKDVDHVIYSFRSDKKVPASALAFAVGKFRQQSISYGIKKITMSTEKAVLSASRQKELLSEAYKILQRTEQVTGFEYPYESLNIVVLKDHHWETRTWGASDVYLYKNMGGMEDQLRRGIYGQWFGVYQREEQWADADAIPLYQTALHYQLTDKPALLKVTDKPDSVLESSYDIFSARHWNQLQKSFQAWKDVNWKTVLITNFSELLSRGGVYTWQDYAENWYKKNGQPHFGVPIFEVLADSARKDSVLYSVNYTLDSQKGNLKVAFKAQHGKYTELTTLPLIQIAMGKVDTSRVTFTGARDSVIVKVNPLVDDVVMDASGIPGLKLDEYKPASFLIYELRNGKTLDQRKEAARKLGNHVNDPDLQLAIKDFMNQAGINPEIKASLLRSLGEIMQGAEGTEQIFIDGLKSENPAVQEAALMSLQNYKNDDVVQQTMQSYVVKADSLPIFKDATRIYSSLADSAAYKNFIRQIVQSDTAGYRAVFAIQEWANAGQAEHAVNQAEFYIDAAYDYPVRATALHILFQHDHATEGWKSRAKQLLNDLDPRIRYLTVKGLIRIKGADFEQLLKNHQPDEYDARVYQAIK